MRIIATAGSPYCRFVEIVSVRPSVRTSVTLDVTLYMLGGVGVWWRTEIAGIDVTRRAESIGERICA